MNPIVDRFIREIRPVASCQYGGLAAVRLARVGGAVVPSPHLAMAPLTSALASGMATVSEIGRGEVGRLRVHNRGGALLFGMAGELVVGGRQDRLLNTSVLIAPGAAVPVHVSCIERDRWEEAGTRRSFGTGRATASPAVRSAVHQTMIANLAQTGVHRTDQNMVWSRVDDTLRRTGVHRAVPTHTLAGGMDHHQARLDAYATACGTIDPTGTQLGLALFTPGTAGAGLHGFSSVDCFGSPDLLGHYANPLVCGAALEAPDLAPTPLVSPAEATAHILAALADQQPVVARPAAGDVPGARELHYCFDGIVASVLCYHEHPVHLSMSPMAGPPPARRKVAGEQPSAAGTIGVPTHQALLQIQCPVSGTRYVRLGYGSYTLGRAHDCDIRLLHESVSRVHARLDISPERTVLRDLGSRNGILVNQEPVLLAELDLGDRITLGQAVELRLLPSAR